MDRSDLETEGRGSQTTVNVDDRLGIPAVPRLVLLSVISSLTCFCLGALAGGRKSAYQFLAENAHRLPRTEQGWYFYHKTKNYRVMQAGIRAGARYAVRTSIWTLTYAGLEAGLDAARGVDAINSLLAATVTAGTFSYASQ